MARQPKYSFNKENGVVIPVLIQPEVPAAVTELQSWLNKAQKAIEDNNKQQLEIAEQNLARFTGKPAKVDIQYQISTVTDKDGNKTLEATQRLHGANTAELSKQTRLNSQSLASLKQQLAREQQILSETVRLGEVKKTLLGTTRQETAEYQKQLQKVKELNQKVAEEGNARKGKSPVGEGFDKLMSIGNKFNQFVMVINSAAMGIQALEAGVAQFVNRAKEVQALQLALEGVNVSIEGQNAVLSSAKAIAMTYGQSISSVESAYKRLAPAIMESGGSLQDTEKVIETLAARTTMLGLNADQSKRYIEAFAQVMGKGKLQSEELTQQFSELDGSLRGQLQSYFASTKGIMNLEEAMKNNQITSGMFMEAMIAIGATAREKVAGDMQNLQKAVSDLGSDSAMNIVQLQNKLDNLAKIGLQEVGKALAPLGKAMASIVVAWVQVWTKIATEMPGIQALFMGIGKVVGEIFKFTANAAILLIAAIAQLVDASMQVTIALAKWLYSLPVIKQVIDLVKTAFELLGKSFDDNIDNFSRLNEKTIGSKDALANYGTEVENLDRKLKAGQITQDEYNKKINELNTQKAKIELKTLQSAYAETEAAIKAGIDRRKLVLEEQQAQADIAIEAIEREGEAYEASLDKQEAAIKAKSQATKRALEDEKAMLEQNKTLKDRSFEDEKNRLDQLKTVTKEYYDTAKRESAAYYDQLKADMEEAHSRRMQAIDAEIAAEERRHNASMGWFDMGGPEGQKLAQMEINKLKKEAANADNAYDRQRALAKLEDIEREKIKQSLQIAHEQRMEELRQKKEQEERRQAAEKKKLDEEEKKRKEQLDAQERESMKAIANALQSIANQKQENDRDHKDAMDEISAKQKENDRNEKDDIDEIKDKRQKAADERKAQIDAIKDALEDEKRKVESIEREIQSLSTATSQYGASIDAVTDGALERQLKKLKEIKAKQAEITAKTGAQPSAPAISQGFAGGYVGAGQKRIVNEIGQEGFITNSGRMMDIATRAWGTWTAPASGTIIPAHIWSEIKASRAAGGAPIISGFNVPTRSGSSVTNSDHIINNVTIQAANTTQAASDMLVSLTKIKRRRYS